LNAAFMAGDSGGLSIRFFLPPVLGVRSFLSREKPLRLPAFARHPIFHGDKDFSPRFLPPRSIPGGPKKKIPRSGPAFSGAGPKSAPPKTVPADKPPWRKWSLLPGVGFGKWGSSKTPG